VTMLLIGANGGTSATVTTDVSLSGKVATMGQGVLQDVSGRLIETFAQNLAAMLAGGGAPAVAAPATPAEPSPAAEAPAPATPREPPPEPAEALDLGSLGGAVIAQRLRDPRALAALLGVVAFVAFRLWRRR
jgi:hypothetical protein